MLAALAPLAVVVAVQMFTPGSRVDRLATALEASAPRYLDRGTATTHVLAAISAETEHFSAELLLGMAYVESRYNPFTVSRVRDGKRKTGVPKWRTPPDVVQGPYFCGPIQAAAKRSWARCRQLQKLSEGYQTGARELENWWRMCKRKRQRDTLRCALWGHGGGWQAVQKRTSTYPSRVLGRQRRIMKLLTVMAPA